MHIDKIYFLFVNDKFKDCFMKKTFLSSLIAKFSKHSVVSVRRTGGGSVSLRGYAGTSVSVLPGTKVTVVAVPNENCDFIGWFIADAKSPVSVDVKYTFTVVEDIALVAKFCKCPVVIIRSAGNGSASFKDTAETSNVVIRGAKVSVVANPDENYDFVGWFVGEEKTPLSTDVEYTFAVIKDIALTAMFMRRFNSNGHGYIDLGLPSGLKWATCNVGASAPEEYGDYYAWGENEEKNNYSWNTYKLCKGSDKTLTKYCSISTLSADGTIDNKSILDIEDDVAHIKWGGDWRIPTKEEVDELRRSCAWEWTSQNGVNGYKGTGPNGNSIFLPAAGYRNGAKVNDMGRCGGYWSSSIVIERCRHRCYYVDGLKFDSDYARTIYFNRYEGLCVRPVGK